MVDISKTILHSFNQNGPRLGLSIDQLIDYEAMRAMPRYRGAPYFFIPRAAYIPIQNENQRVLGDFRHCKIYNDVFLDYTVRPTKAFPTLEEWAADVGSTIENVRFGYESQDPGYKSFSIVELIEPMEKTMKVLHVGEDEFLQLETRLQQVGLGIANVAVLNNNRVIMARDFMQGL